MPQIPPPPGYGLYSRSFREAGAGKPMTVVIGYQNPLGEDAPVSIGRIRTSLTTTTSMFNPAFYDGGFDAVSDYCLVNNGGILTSFGAVFAIAGSRSGSTPPPATSVVVRKATARAGKQFRGRIALPSCFIDEADIDENGVILGSVLTALQARVTTTLANMTASQVPMVLLHQMSLAGTIPPPTPVVQLQVSGFVGSQRKRQRRK